MGRCAQSGGVGISFFVRSSSLALHLSANANSTGGSQFSKLVAATSFEVNCNVEFEGLVLSISTRVGSLSHRPSRSGLLLAGARSRFVSASQVPAKSNSSFGH